MKLPIFASALLLFYTPSHSHPRLVPHYKNQVAVLVYHHVHNTDKSLTTIPTSLFRNQISFLKKKGYHFITLQQFKRFMSGAPVADNAVMITFDDGNESFYKNALPILKEYQIPAVNFIITYSLHHPEQDTPPKLSRAQMKEIAASLKQVDFQCHTHAYHFRSEKGVALLLKSNAETEKQYHERIRSDTKACINSLKPYSLGTVDSMAYPFGIYNKKAREELQASGIKFAFTTKSFIATRSSNPMRIPRLNAGNPYITPAMLNGMILRRVNK